VCSRRTLPQYGMSAFGNSLDLDARHGASLAPLAP
jgi:hypothetical protein